jgi:transcriptional regulator GlxA family with amidase domain
VSGPIGDAWVIFGNGNAIGLDRLIPKGCAYARFLDPAGLCLPLLEKAALIGKREGAAGFWKAQAVLCEIIGLLMSARQVKNETYEVGFGKGKTDSDSWLESVQEYLRSQYARPVRLHDLARHFNVSLSTLCHRYHEATGQSPINDHLRMRVELVKTLLLKGRRLKEIAEETGFYDQYHLSKMFKHLTGLSPRQFVRSLAIRKGPEVLP